MAEKSLILCDTNVLIKFFRGDEQTKIALKNIGESNIAISVVTKAEILVGTNKVNYSRILEIVNAFELVHIDTEASIIFARLTASKKIFNSEKHIPDLLIAATAIANNLPLYTVNLKDFQSLPDITLYKPST